MPTRRFIARCCNLDAALPVPTALPINLLARRPGCAVRAPHDRGGRLRSASPIAAAFYPDVNLQALAGIGAFGLSNLVQGSARGYGAGPLISLPLFDGGRLRAQYQSSEAQLDAAIAGYNDTVLRAVQQTADQLTRIDALARERVEQQADARGQRSGLQARRGALPRRPRELSLRAQCGNAGADCAPAMVDIIADQAVARVTLLLRRRRQLRCARIGRALGKEFRPSFDTGNTMNTKDSNETSPSTPPSPAAAKLRTRAPLGTIRLGRRGRC